MAADESAYKTSVAEWRRYSLSERYTRASAAAGDRILQQGCRTLTYRIDPILQSWALFDVSFPSQRERVATHESEPQPVSSPAGIALNGRPFSFMSDGVFWTVREYASGSPMADVGDACLIFESDNLFRRVRNFPSNWRELGADTLLAVSWAK
jgi:hypothetical protein